MNVCPICKGTPRTDHRLWCPGRRATMKTLVVYNIGSDSEILCIVICDDDAEITRARQSIKDYFASAPSPDQWPNQDIEDWLVEHGFRADAEPEQEWLE